MSERFISGLPERDSNPPRRTLEDALRDAEAVVRSKSIERRYGLPGISNDARAAESAREASRRLGEATE